MLICAIFPRLVLQSLFWLTRYIYVCMLNRDEKPWKTWSRKSWLSCSRRLAHSRYKKIKYGDVKTHANLASCTKCIDISRRSLYFYYGWHGKKTFGRLLASQSLLRSLGRSLGQCSQSSWFCDPRRARLVDPAFFWPELNAKKTKLMLGAERFVCTWFELDGYDRTCKCSLGYGHRQSPEWSVFRSAGKRAVA